jgi:DnaJ-class molecular chaperone
MIMTEDYENLNHFKVLELDEDCSSADVKQSYLRLAKKLHPDINNSPDAATQFKAVSNAYDVLKNDGSRLRYLSFIKFKIHEDMISRSMSDSSYSSSNYSGDIFSQRHYNNIEKGKLIITKLLLSFT